MARPRKARAEGAAVKPKPVPNPVPGDDGDALNRIVASFRARFPEEWDKLALCPLQHGLGDMTRLMQGRG